MFIHIVACIYIYYIHETDSIITMPEHRELTASRVKIYDIETMKDYEVTLTYIGEM